MAGYPCPKKLCPNYGKQCWNHCNHCGDEVTWRPKGLDWEVKYTGPRPLNATDGKPHRCMHKGEVKQYKKITGDPIIDSIDYAQELYDFLKTSRWHYQTLK